MEFHVYHDQMVFSKAAAYILMAIALACSVGWWKFLTGKEPKKNDDH
ncbi:sulfate respiration complex protein HmcD [Fundidesulfovibrio soli]|nr:hypothetical protein [Fundidesulfovibrio soli]